MRFIRSILVSFCLCAAAMAEPSADISPAELETRLANGEAGLIVLDVRTAEEFAAGHVPGALNIPHDQIASRIEELTDAREREIVVYCRSGRRAGLVLDTLAEAGFDRLAHLEGDILRWREEGYPTESTQAPAAVPAGDEDSQSLLQP